LWPRWSVLWAIRVQPSPCTGPHAPLQELHVTVHRQRGAGQGAFVINHQQPIHAQPRHRLRVHAVVTKRMGLRQHAPPPPPPRLTCNRTSTHAMTVAFSTTSSDASGNDTSRSSESTLPSRLGSVVEDCSGAWGVVLGTCDQHKMCGNAMAPALDVVAHGTLRLPSRIRTFTSGARAAAPKNSFTTGDVVHTP